MDDPRALDDNLTPAQLLRACLRARWQPGALDAVRAQASTAVWEAVASQAEREALAPLLYHTVRTWHVLPAPVAERLRLAYYGTARRNLILLNELERILKLLSAAGVPAIMLKGAALALAVYGNPAVRPMSDVDLLLHRPDVQRAIDILATVGYTPASSEPHPGDLLAYENEIMLTAPDPTACPIELHWSLFDSPAYQRRLPLDWFWRTAQPMQVGQTSSLLLGPEAQILHLCGHLALHHGAGEVWQGLWLYDVAQVIAFYGEQIDWDDLLAHAVRCDLVLPVQKILAQAAEDWQPPLPAGALERLAGLQPSRHERQLFAEMTAARRPVARRLWADLAGLPGWRERLRFAWTNLFPGAAYMRQRYGIRHRLLLPLYYPYRWLLGLWGLMNH